MIRNAALGRCPMRINRRLSAPIVPKERDHRSGRVGGHGLTCHRTPRSDRGEHPAVRRELAHVLGTPGAVEQGPTDSRNHDAAELAPRHRGGVRRSRDVGVRPRRHLERRPRGPAVRRPPLQVVRRTDNHELLVRPRICVSVQARGEGTALVWNERAQSDPTKPFRRPAVPPRHGTRRAVPGPHTG